MYLGNVILLVLNLPLVGLWAKLLEIRYQFLYPGILLFCILGAYSLNQSVFDVGVMIVFGVLGYIFRKIDWPLAPTVLALILGPMMERALRTSLEMSAGDLTILVTRPISAVLIIIAAIVLLTPGIRLLGKKAGKDEGG
jgi:putative tricarboxylic transport membrane protein